MMEIQSSYNEDDETSDEQQQLQSTGDTNTEEQEEEIPPCDIIQLLSDVVTEKEKFMKLAPFKADDIKKKIKRCNAFPYTVPKSVLDELHKGGYYDWVGITVNASRDIIVQQTAQFLIFCKSELKSKLK